MSTAVITQPPRTMMEVFQNLPEGTLAQLIENNLIMSPAPTYRHQHILMKIIGQLQPFIEHGKLGEIVVAPVDVYLNDKNAYQPDIIYVSKERQFIIEEDGLHGAPDLVIEILSPRTAKYDLEEKKDVYERSGVKEYWTVEPESGSVQGWFLVESGYEEVSAGKGKIPSRLLKDTFTF